MKKLNFSRLSMLLAAAFVTVSLFSVTSCKPDAEADPTGSGTPTQNSDPSITAPKPVALSADDPLIGDWISQFTEKYSITQTDYDNYYDGYYDENYQKQDAGTFYLYYSTTDIKKLAVDEKTGYLYGKFDDAEHIGSGAEEGQWYALYYIFTENGVRFHQPYKANGKAACDTLEEAIAEFTVANGYYDLGSPSECTKK